MAVFPSLLMPPRQQRITVRTLLGHMRTMQRVLMEEIRAVRTDLSQRIDRVEGKLDRLEVKVDRNHGILSMQIASIDQRLDHIEVEAIPALRKAVKQR